MVWGVSKKQKIGIDVANARECHEEREKKANAGARAAGRGTTITNGMNRMK